MRKQLAVIVLGAAIAASGGPALAEVPGPSPLIGTWSGEWTNYTLDFNGRQMTDRGVMTMTIRSWRVGAIVGTLEVSGATDHCSMDVGLLAEEWGDFSKFTQVNPICDKGGWVLADFRISWEGRGRATYSEGLGVVGDYTMKGRLRKVLPQVSPTRVNFLADEDYELTESGPPHETNDAVLGGVSSRDGIPGGSCFAQVRRGGRWIRAGSGNPAHVDGRGAECDPSVDQRVVGLSGRVQLRLVFVGRKPWANSVGRPRWFKIVS